MSKETEATHFCHCEEEITLLRAQVYALSQSMLIIVKALERITGSGQATDETSGPESDKPDRPQSG